MYYRAAFPWHVASSKQQTLKGPSGPHPVRDQNQWRSDDEEEKDEASRELNTISYDGSSEQRGEHTKITNFMNPAQGQMETIT